MTVVRNLAARLQRDRNGAAALEFAILAPILLLIMAGTTDLGLGVLTRIRMDEGVASAANSALNYGSSLSSSTVDAAASSIATILQRTRGFTGYEATYTISFNGSRTYDFVGGKGTASGSSAGVDECRCPMQANGIVTWGSKVDCSTSCPNKSLAGRYVLIDMKYAYTPLFPKFGLIGNEGIHVQAFALVQ